MGLARPVALGLVLCCACAADPGSSEEGTGVPATCPAHLADPEVRHEVTGDNGTFLDACDAAGNLVDYECATTTVWVCNDWECFEDLERTATVTPTSVECAGTCVAGVCASRCPADGAIVRFDTLGMDGVGVLREVATGERWSCFASGVTFVTPEGPQNFLGRDLTVDRDAWGTGQLCLPGAVGYLYLDGSATPMPVGWGCVIL